MTTFTAGPGIPTLPIWIFDNLFRPNQAPVVNVVAVVLVVISILPVWAAQRLGGEAAAESRHLELLDHHVELLAVLARVAELDLPAEVGDQRRRGAAGVFGVAPCSSRARTRRPLVALLKWLTTLALRPPDLVQHPHGRDLAREVGLGAPERA